MDRKGHPDPPSAAVPGATAQLMGGGQGPWAWGPRHPVGSRPLPRPVLGPVLALALCPQADRAGGLGLGGRGRDRTQLLQPHSREGTAPGRAGGLQAHPRAAALCPRGPWPGQPLGPRGEGVPGGPDPQTLLLLLSSGILEEGLLCRPHLLPPSPSCPDLLGPILDTSDGIPIADIEEMGTAVIESGLPRRITRTYPRETDQPWSGGCP